MIEYVLGQLAEVSPTLAVVDINGIGYAVHITVPTYTLIKDKKQVKLFCHPIIREDAHTLYGFADKKERHLFQSLISVSGVGASTARMILSAGASSDIESAILSGDTSYLKRIKGIGGKTAERIIVDLKDKIGKDSGIALDVAGNETKSAKQEAVQALLALGFGRNAIEKALQKVIQNTDEELAVESIIKSCLKYL